MGLIDFVYSAWLTKYVRGPQPANSSTGLNQIGARNYDPDTGRFISLDPILNGGDPTAQRLQIHRQQPHHLQRPQRTHARTG
jgi:RHS repeat-associated protein